MAAVLLSSTVHSTPHYTEMGHDEHLSSTPTSRRRSSDMPPRVPASPKNQPLKVIPSQSAANTLNITPATSSQHLDARNVFASQRPFSSDGTNHLSPSHSDSHLFAHAAASRSGPSVCPTLTNNPLHRSPWSSNDVSQYGGATIEVRDLAHIQSFATEDFLTWRNSQAHRKSCNTALKYEISGMPIGDIIEMVAGLLTKITTTNDHQHRSMHEHIPTTEHAVNMPGLSSSVFAFHGKNVPSITILSYLSRIHKYCPTTYEVFLSLLVYFDRMTERVNAKQRNSKELQSSVAEPTNDGENLDMSSVSSSMTDLHAQVSTLLEDDRPHHLSHYFVVDSFNIHRLVIAGVTCASKFFSDVFYTNSRYAKVGGLPLGELNHLELQFLLLNDFRLNIPVRELEAYGTMLVEFYAREIIAQRKANVDEDDFHNTPPKLVESD